jgi:ribose transport system substrate-binding protein
MENILQAQSNIQAVFAHNDEMALGALEACKSAGKTNIMIVGFDASADAVTAVKNGTMAATIAQQPELMAQSGIDTALKVMKGESVDKSISIPLKLVTK